MVEEDAVVVVAGLVVHHNAAMVLGVLQQLMAGRVTMVLLQQLQHLLLHPQMATRRIEGETTGKRDKENCIQNGGQRIC